MTAPGKDRGLSAPALAKVCGVTPRTLRNWLAATPPLPHSTRGNRHRFDPQAVADWLATTGKHEPLVRMNGYIASLGADQPTPRPKTEEDTAAEAFAKRQKRQMAQAARQAAQESQTEESRKVAATAWNIFKVRDTTAKLYADSVRLYVNAPASEKIAHQKNVNAAADILRKLEMDAIAVAKEMGLVMLVADAAKIMGEAAASIKHDLLTLPHAVAADLAALDDEKAVAALLEERIHDVLRHVAEALQKLAKQEMK